MAIDKEKINQPKIKKIKNKILTIYSYPITQELLFAGIGSLGFQIFYSFLPKICWEEVYRNITKTKWRNIRTRSRRTLYRRSKRWKLI